MTGVTIENPHSHFIETFLGKIINQQLRTEEKEMILWHTNMNFLENIHMRPTMQPLHLD